MDARNHDLTKSKLVYVCTYAKDFHEHYHIHILWGHSCTRVCLHVIYAQCVHS